jgi:outer membrane lipoprotein-sorting protein
LRRSGTTTADRIGRADNAAGVVALAAVLSPFLAGCPRSPPPSRFPTADLAIAKMRDTLSCSRGVRGESKVDYFGEQGRVRGTTLFVASRPDSIRFDVLSPFGVNLSTLTSDGRNFALLDVGAKVFFRGPASECNVARFLHVPVPPFALVDLLAGEAPVLVHGPSDALIDWDSGAYRVSISSRHGASEEIRLEPTPEDWNKAWSQQRLRVREVRVRQQGVELYRAVMDDFEAATTSAPSVDPDGLEPDVPPSGPPCTAEIPRRIHVTSEAAGEDVLIEHREIHHNPPLVPNLFRQEVPGGVKIRTASCP